VDLKQVNSYIIPTYFRDNQEHLNIAPIGPHCYTLPAEKLPLRKNLPTSKPTKDTSTKSSKTWKAITKVTDVATSKHLTHLCQQKYKEDKHRPIRPEVPSPGSPSAVRPTGKLSQETVPMRTPVPHQKRRAPSPKTYDLQRNGR
jgi:hypothetical protein